MARFRCITCRKDGEVDYDPTRHECPRRGSSDVVFALSIDELPDKLIEVLSQAKPLDDHPTDEDD
jgi:hypothetical protein